MTIEIVLVGAHMTGLPLNGDIVALGGQFLRQAQTRPCYRLYALPGGPPQRPGLLRVPSGGAIAVEVWALPSERIGALLASIPAPLGLGTVLLADGTSPKGFLVEAEGIRGAADITHFGGWRAFLATSAGAAREAASVDAACALFDIPMRPEWRDAALANFGTIATAARAIAAFPLDDEAEYGPVFRP